MNIILTDTNEQATLILKNDALSNRIGRLHPAPTVTLEEDKQVVYASLMQPESIAASLQNHRLSVTGKLESLKEPFPAFEAPDVYFNIIEPQTFPASYMARLKNLSLCDL